MGSRKKIEWIGLAGHCGVKITPKEGDSKESSVFRASQGQAFLSLVGKTFIDKIKEIQARFKPEIQPEQITKLADELLIQVKSRMADFLNPIAQSYRNMQGDVFKLSISPFGDAVAAINRLGIRQRLQQLDSKQRLEVFNQAVEKGKDEILNAFFENSEFYGLLSPEIIANGKKQWLLRKDPTLAANYFETETAGSVLERDFESIIQDLAAYSSVKPENIQKMLADIPRPGWSHTKTSDENMINSGVMPSMLPPPSNK